MKRCSWCKETLPHELFYFITTRNAYDSWCKPCRLRRPNELKRQKLGLPADAVLKPGNAPKPDGHTYTHRGYVMEKRVGHHRADKYGFVPQHVLVAEDHYGVVLTRDYTVHHKNRNKGDNRPENLDIRVGNHGVGGDVIETLIHGSFEHRAKAIDALRSLGFFVGEPGVT